MKNILILMSILSLKAAAWTHVANNLKGWSNHTVTFSVNTDECTLPAETVFEIIDEALTVWNSLPNTDLQLVRSTTPSTATPQQVLDGDASEVAVIVCSNNFSQILGVDGDQIPAVTYPIYVSSAGNIIYSGVFLNAEAGMEAEMSVIDRGTLGLILAHEIGHALGLGHSGNSKALMYYSVAGKNQALLTLDDQDGIAQLYPKSEFAGGTFGCSAVHQKNTAVPFGGILTCLLLLISTLLLGRKIRSGPLP